MESLTKVQQKKIDKIDKSSKKMIYYLTNLKVSDFYHKKMYKILDTNAFVIQNLLEDLPKSTKIVRQYRRCILCLMSVYIDAITDIEQEEFESSNQKIALNIIKTTHLELKTLNESTAKNTDDSLEIFEKARKLQTIDQKMLGASKRSWSKDVRQVLFWCEGGFSKSNQFEHGFEPFSVHEGWLKVANQLVFSFCTANLDSDKIDSILHKQLQKQMKKSKTHIPLSQITRSTNLVQYWIMSEQTIKSFSGSKVIWVTLKE